MGDGEEKQLSDPGGRTGFGGDRQVYEKLLANNVSFVLEE